MSLPDKNLFDHLDAIDEIKAFDHIKTVREKFELYNCEILKEDRKIDAVAVNRLLSLVSCGGLSSPSKEELKNCTCSKWTQFQ